MTKVSSNWKSSIKAGNYQRKASPFRQWLSADGSTGLRLSLVVIIYMSHLPVLGRIEPWYFVN